MKHLLIFFLYLIVIDFSVIDRQGDPQNKVIIIHYSDGTNDKLVVPSEKLDTDEMYENVNKIIKYRTQENSL